MSLSSLQRLAIALCGTVFLCLFSVAIADAAPYRARVVSHKLCGARTTPCRVKARLPKAPRAPVQYFVRVQRLVRHHSDSWLERSRPDPLRENDDAALQDRTAVVRGEDDLLLRAALEPLGVLTIPQCPITISAVLTRHSPRGPPPLPGFV
jgi:hypothetical protein